MEETKNYIKDFFRTYSIEIFAIFAASFATQQFWTGNFISSYLVQYTTAIIFVFNALLIAGAFGLARFLHKTTGKEYIFSPVVFSIISIIFSFLVWQNPPWCFDQDAAKTMRLEVYKGGSTELVEIDTLTSFDDHVYALEPSTLIDIKLSSDDQWLQVSNYRRCNWLSVGRGEFKEEKTDGECSLRTTILDNLQHELIRLDLSQPGCQGHYSEVIFFTRK